MSYIYKISNDINDKVYIGKTEFSIERRFKEHCKDAFRERNEKRPLYNAMKKYGIEHFHIELIEETEQAEQAEIYWINFYDSYLKGYNATMGGEGKPLYDYNQILAQLKQGYNGREAAKNIGCCVDLVYQVAQQNNIDLKSKSGQNFLKNQKSVSAYSKNNDFIKNFESTAMAAKWCYENQKCSSLNSGVRGHIAEVANGKRKSAYGYIWKYK